MRWQGHRQSRNVEDRRSGSAMGGRSLGIGSIVIAVVLGWVFGINPLTVLGIMQGVGPAVTQQAPVNSNETAAIPDKAGQFASVVLADTEDVWNQLFQNYQEPRMVLYRTATRTACGVGQAAMGPFYCPSDSTVYIDLDFFNELKNRLGAPGEFAQAYVIAHEVGHHVQNLQGTLQKIHRLQGKVSQTEFNQLNVRLEPVQNLFANLFMLVA